MSSGCRVNVFEEVRRDWTHVPQAYHDRVKPAAFLFSKQVRVQTNHFNPMRADDWPHLSQNPPHRWFYLMGLIGLCGSVQHMCAAPDDNFFELSMWDNTHECAEIHSSSIDPPITYMKLLTARRMMCICRVLYWVWTAQEIKAVGRSGFMGTGSAQKVKTFNKAQQML